MTDSGLSKPGKREPPGILEPGSEKCHAGGLSAEKEVRYQLPELSSLLVGDSSGQRDGSYSARLGHSNDALAADPPFVEVLWELRRLPGASFP